MISPGRDNSDFDFVLGIPIQELVVDEDLVERVQVINSSFSVDHESVRVHFNVWRSPATQNRAKIMIQLSKQEYSMLKDDVVL